MAKSIHSLVVERLTRPWVVTNALKASNFLLGDDGPVIIDLDSMKEHTNPVDKDRANVQVSPPTRRAPAAGKQGGTSSVLIAA